MQQAEDFKEESSCLERLLFSLGDGDYDQATQFKNWTISDILRHLYLFNEAAKDTLVDQPKFIRLMNDLQNARKTGMTLLEIQLEMLDGFSGKALLNLWGNSYRELAKIYSSTNPKKRVKWAGPDMSARSSITARQMETWAHGQAVFDLFGKKRHETDRIKNIAHLGVSTYGWTFINRGLAMPEPAPYVCLVSPKGEKWEWNNPHEDTSVFGLAVEFSQVVTQVRNIADTSIVTKGENAIKWMAVAQCFAGEAQDPPKPGTRKTVIK